MITLIRHPETEWNIHKLAQGRLDSPITNDGLSATLKFVQDTDFESVVNIYHANNRRCAFLAYLLWHKYPHAQIMVEDRLNERDFGVFEGIAFEDIDKSTGDFDPTNLIQRYNWQPAQGESFAQVSERANEFISELINKQQQALCITSGGVIRNVMHIQKELTLNEMFALKIGNLSIHAI